MGQSLISNDRQTNRMTTLTCSQHSKFRNRKQWTAIFNPLFKNKSISKAMSLIITVNCLMQQRVTLFYRSSQSKSMDIKNKILQPHKHKSWRDGLFKTFKILIWRKKTVRNSVKKLDLTRGRSQIGLQMSAREFGNH